MGTSFCALWTYIEDPLNRIHDFCSFTGPKFLTRLPAKTSFLGGHCCGRSAGPIAFDCKRARLFASEALSRLGGMQALYR